MDYTELLDKNKKNKHNVVEVGPPSMEGPKLRATVMGSCNGLLCLYENYWSILRKNSYIIWNPSTGKHWTLPRHPPELLSLDLNNVIYGFGYVSHANDYKFVIILYQSYVSHANVSVYSLRANSWRRASGGQHGNSLDIPGHIKSIPSRFGVLVNECLHWVDSGNQILAFEIEYDSFRMVPFPDNKITDVHVSIKTLGGCLCVFYELKDVGLEVCVMKEYGVKESWTKLLTVNFPYHKFRGVPRCSGVVPLTYSMDGNKILFERRCIAGQWFFSYNLMLKTVENVEIDDMPDRFDVMAYSQSLVNPNFRGLHDEQKQHTQTKNRRRLLET